jgi:MOSC domain-containing protein YiiM
MSRRWPLPPLTGSRRPNFYLRVLKEGDVGADDPVVRKRLA